MTNAGPTNIGHAVAEAFVRAREALRPLDRAHADKRLTEWLDATEAALTHHLDPLLRPLVEADGIPPDIANLLRVALEPEQGHELAIVLAVIGATILPLVQAFFAPGVRAIENVAWAIPGNDVTPLPPAELALGVVRNTLGDLDPHAEAAKWGLSPHKFDVLALNTGDAPPVEELLLLLRRACIDQPTFEKGLRQGRLRDEWIPQILELQYQPPSAAQAIAANVANHLTTDQAKDKARIAGLNPDEYDWLYQTAGRPIGIQEALQLFNRGLLPKDDPDPKKPSLFQVIRESDVKDKYADAIFNSRVYLPPVRSIPTMLRHGSITEARARELLADHGVQPADIDGYIKEANSTRTANQKEISATQATKAYEYKLITAGELQTRLTALGYSAADAQLWQQIADESRHDRFVQAAVNRVHNLYVNHKITRVEASTLMDADAIPATARDDWLTLWDHERAANVRIPTEAQLAGGLHRGAITDQQFIDGVLALGYRRSDVLLLAAMAFPPTQQPANLPARFG